MKFQAAFSYLKRGHDIKLPEWGGFWRWDEESKSIHMHTRKGTILDIRDSEDMDYTLGFTFRDDWELVKDPAQTEPAKTTAPTDSLEDQLARIVEQSPPVPQPAVGPERSSWAWSRKDCCPRCGQWHSVWFPCPSYTLCTA